MTALRPSPITTTIDYDRDGVQHGHLKVPHSRDDSAWGSIMIPITVARNGDGPTALLTGGNHGDEYEGPTAIVKLAEAIRQDDIRGTVIALPFLNYPAFRSARRTSPIDGGNMNRTFPGRPDGTITEKIADYVMRHLVSRADCVLDIHAGGKTLDFVPFAAIHVLADKNLENRCEAAMRAFGAPWSMRLLELDAVGMLDTVVEEAGKVFVSTELGGGGATTAKSVAIADRGVRGFLANAGIWQKPVEPSPTTMLDMPDGDCYVTSLHAGLLEMLHDLGDEVTAGEPIARIHSITATGEAPVTYAARRGGVISGRHFPGLITIGDPIAVVATRVD